MALQPPASAAACSWADHRRRPPPPVLQIRYLNRGAYGFVILAHDNATGENVALKFIKRGPQVRAGRRPEPVP